MSNELVVAATILAGVVSFLAVRAWKPLLERFGALDVPNHRSSHSRPTMRGGGIGPLTGQVFVIPTVALFGMSNQDQSLYLLVALFATLIGLVGLVEDLKGISSAIRAGMQLMLGLLFSVIVSFQLEFHWIWLPLAALLIAANVNFVNFMDGVNGISGLFALVVGVSYFVVGFLNESSWLMLGGGVLAVSFGSFLFWNFLPPGIFLGDVGSYLLGGTTILLLLAGIWSGIDPLVLFAPLSIYWVDTISTILRRLIRRERIFEAHRSHVYQKLAQAGMSHLGVALLVAIFSSVVTVLAMVPEFFVHVNQWVVLIAIVFLWVCYLALPKVVNSKKKVS